MYIIFISLGQKISLNVKKIEKLKTYIVHKLNSIERMWTVKLKAQICEL